MPPAASKSPLKCTSSSYFKSDEFVRESENDDDGEEVVISPTHVSRTAKTKQNPIVSSTRPPAVRPSSVTHGSPTKKRKRDVPGPVRSSDILREKGVNGEIRGRAEEEERRGNGGKERRKSDRSAGVQSGSESGRNAINGGESNEDSRSLTETTISRKYERARLGYPTR